MMTSSQLLEILNLCKEMDVVASKIYTKIAKMQSGRGEQSFWKTMAKEEREHVIFWQRAIAFCHENTVPDIFYDMGEVISDLNSSLKKALALYDNINTDYNESNYFLTAYWMEFYLLYPSFITIFHYMGILSVEGNPEHEYEQHIIGFVDGFSKYGRSTPEMELLGSLLHNLWRRNKELVSSSMYDGLTQLMNRKGMFDAMVSFASLAQRNNYAISILMIDIDDFKKINDTYGHQAGDEVLKVVSGCIRKNIRKSDLVGRFGGEEFIVFLVNANDKSVVNLAEKLRKSIELLDIISVKVTVSIGCSVRESFSGDIGDDLENAIHVADENLYTAKRNGKNQVVL